ncbi:MAG: hypothetical protein ABSE06_15510 [Anaerolineaceae bacterium]|jgi:hypothetical protein
MSNNGVDKTAEELAVVRLQEEIADLTAEKNSIYKVHPYPLGYSIFVLIFLIMIGGMFLYISTLAFTNPNLGSVQYILFALPGLGLIIFGILPIIKGDPKKIREKETWESTTGITIKSINEKIAKKEAELAYNKKLVAKQHL